MKKFTLMVATATTLLTANADYAVCAGCHGNSGEKQALGKSKVIKDMTPTELAKSLNGYKDGTYGGPLAGLMKGQVQNLTEVQIKSISEYIAKGK